MMKKCFLVISLPLIWATSAYAEWTALESTTKQGEKHSFDAQTVQQNESFRKIWILSSYDEKQKGGYHAIKTLYELDCAHQKARTVTVLLYPDKTASEAVIGARHDETTDWFRYLDDSIFYHVSAIVCAT